jgi:hypothetical protein
MDESTRIGQPILLLELDDDKIKNWDNFGKMDIVKQLKQWMNMGKLDNLEKGNIRQVFKSWPI